ncbi:MAG: bifunctional diaminohydroxyphosphoribosylaminopyrimidine deaminase/5-amino-6-(5-phosphoribosylamino)uracil reductase RibD [Candidatus Omnitrophota bacterium]
MDDIKYMKMALTLAGLAKERTYPNPMVGAVIVKNGKVIGKGYHRRAGGDHAEVSAIKDAGIKCRRADMYVSLEPCDHYGKTPPCTKAIISSGIKKVIIAIKDPNPINSGRGIKKLAKAGILTKVGVCKDEAESFLRKYIKFITKNLPYVTLKLAQSVDGKIAAADGSSKWISGERSRQYVRRLRSGFDAVMVGSNTVVNDDPLLFGTLKGKEYITRIVVDSTLKLPFESKLLKTADKGNVIIGTTVSVKNTKLSRLTRIKNVDVIVCGRKNKKVDLKDFFLKLAERGIVNVLVEGGGELAGSLFDEKLVDEVLFFISPKIIGGGYSSVKGRGAGHISKALDLKDMRIKRIGDDFLIKGTVSQ